MAGGVRGGRLGRAAVSGTSMAPTLLSGDLVVLRRPAAPRVGLLVVARRADRPELLVVKRITARVDAGWWLAGDNPAASDDSRLFGPVPDEAVLARVVARYWPLARVSVL